MEPPSTSTSIRAFWRQNGFPDPKNMILEAVECLKSAVGYIFGGMKYHRLVRLKYKN